MSRYFINKILDNKPNINNLENIENAKKFLTEYNILKDNFELEKYVCSGGESVVYSINILDNKKKEIKGKAVMKILYKITNEREEREAKKEAYLSYKLKDKNIINYIWNSKIEKGKPAYIVMEEAEFGNIRSFLRNSLKRNTMTESMICFIAYQVLNGIKYCHRCKIAHMDIKLQNIVINKYLNVKLIDFSISLYYKNKDKNDEITLGCRGTKFYMSKEVLLSEKIKVRDISKIDLYAFGVVLFNLAFNCFPFGLTYGDEKNNDIILNKINDGKIGFKNTEDYSNHFMDFLEKLLQKDINKRISLEEALNHYWIKGGNILLAEKEKCFNTSIFTSYLVTDHIKAFNDYIYKHG